MKKIYFITASVIILNCCSAFCQVVTYNFTGGTQNYTVPAGVTTICVDVRGAKGMSNVNGNVGGGLGGRVTGTLTVVAGAVLQINVGGGGAVSNAGGFNGGARGGSVTSNGAENPPTCATSWGGGGGGASDIRVSPYGLGNRVVVGGGWWRNRR